MWKGGINTSQKYYYCLPLFPYMLALCNIPALSAPYGVCFPLNNWMASLIYATQPYGWLDPTRRDTFTLLLVALSTCQTFVTPQPLMARNASSATFNPPEPPLLPLLCLVLNAISSYMLTEVLSQHSNILTSRLVHFVGRWRILFLSWLSQVMGRVQQS